MVKDNIYNICDEITQYLGCAHLITEDQITEYIDNYYNYISDEDREIIKLNIMGFNVSDAHNFAEFINDAELYEQENKASDAEFYEFVENDNFLKF